VGYSQIEFFGYDQHRNAAGGANPGPGDPAAYLDYARTIRGFLDDHGLAADGNHGYIPSSWPPNMTAKDRARFDLELEFASILGTPHLGTGGDPTAGKYKFNWDLAAEKWNALGEIAQSHDIKLYSHNHDAAYDFLLDSPPYDDMGRPTRSSGIRRLEYFLTVTDDSFVWLEMDIYWAHVAQHRFREYTAPDGQTVTDIFDPAALVAANKRRYPVFHAKDGVRTDDPPGVGSGYEMVPFGESGEESLGMKERGIDFTSFFKTIGGPNLHYINYEQDNAPGAPFQSLLFAALSHRNMSWLTHSPDEPT
jgi:sugar phosphate isomerase/epimerase